MAQPTEERKPRLGPVARSWLRATVVVALVVAADQITKHAARSSIRPGKDRLFLPGVDLVNPRNHGVAFGFLPGSHVGVTILIAVALLVLLGYFALNVTRPLI